MTTLRIHARRQHLLLGSVVALTAKAGLGLLAYQAVPAIDTSDLVVHSVGASIGAMATIGFAMHVLHPELSKRHKLLWAVVIGGLLGAGVGGLVAIEDAQTLTLTALRVAGDATGMLSSMLFGVALFVGDVSFTSHRKNRRG